MIDLQTTETVQTPVIINTPGLFRYLKRKIWWIVAASLVFGGLGALVSVMMPEEYTSSVQILPEQTKTGGGGLGALSDLTGMSFGMIPASEAIRPDLYPNVLKSSPFLLKLIELPVSPQDQQGQEKVAAFLTRKGKSNFTLFSSKDTTAAVKLTNTDSLNNDILLLDKQKSDLLRNLRTRIVANYDKKSGIILIDVLMPDPVVAAQVADFSTSYLIDYMLRYRSGKQADEVEFLERQMNNARSRFYGADRAVKSYRDRNRNPFFNISGAEETRLQSELSIAQGLYNSLANQYEQAQLKLRQETPVLKILDPPTIPLKRTSPQRTLITLGAAVGGALLMALFFSLKLMAKS